MARTPDRRFPSTLGLRRIFDAVPDIVCILDPDDRIQSVNRAFERILGWSRSEWLGRRFSPLVHPEDAALASEVVEAAASGGASGPTRLRIRRKDGGWSTLEARLRAEFERGALTHIVGLARDVTELQRTEEALSERAQLLDLAADAIIVRSPEGQIYLWNQGAERLYGWTEAEARGRRTHDLLQTRFPVSLKEQEQALRGKGGWFGELRHRAKDGRSVIVESRQVVRPAQGGLPEAVLEINRDVTERRRAERELKESEERFRRLVDHVRDFAIYSLDEEGRIATWNSSCERLYGWKAEQILGRSVSEFYPEGDRRHRALEKTLECARAEGRCVEQGWRRRRDGTRFWTYCVTTAVRTEDGRVTGFARIVRDETERMHAEEALRRQKQELERSNRELESFAYAASHDLQEPLRKMASFSQLLSQRLGPKLDEDDKTVLGKIVDGAERMRRMIDSLLEYARVGRGAPLQAVEAGGPLLSALASLELAVRGAGVRVTYDPLPAVLANADLLEQLFLNLVSNAVKFRGPQSPRVHVAAVRSGADWEFSVSDNGIGIPPPDRERVFALFQRLHGRSEYPGSGIGLALCKKIIEVHGGRIWVDASRDGGADFRFTLRAAAPSSSPEPKAA